MNNQSLFQDEPKKLLTDGTLRGALAELLKKGYSNRELWDIISALRGPDEREFTSLEGDVFYDTSVKSATTAVIRKAIGLNEFATEFVIVQQDTPRFVKVRKKLSDVNGHFLTHTKKAFQVLNLKWDELNENI